MSLQRSQSWLAGQQMPLDSFLTHPEPSTSTRGTKRKSDNRDATAGIDKNSRAKPSKSKQTVLADKKINKQPVLRDITKQHNSPRSRRAATRKAYSLKSPGKKASGSDERRSNARKPALSDKHEGNSDREASDHLPSLPTPVHPRKSRKDMQEACLLTPPDSKPRSSGNSAVNNPSSLRDSRKNIFGSKPEMSTPFTMLIKHPYPTPDSEPLSRIDARPLAGGRLSLSTAGTESEPPASPPISALLIKKMLEEASRTNDMGAQEETVPSSQTQYLHFSQKKREPGPTLSIPTFASVIDPLCVPSSQSQPAVYSPRRFRKPPPLSTRPVSIEGQELRAIVDSEFFVPTSQEDELEISLQDERCPDASQTVKLPLRSGSDMDSTPLERSISPSKTQSASVNRDDHRPRHRSIFENQGLAFALTLAESASQIQEASQYLMPSSLTELDASSEDPFASTNPVYKAYLSSRTTPAGPSTFSAIQTQEESSEPARSGYYSGEKSGGLSRLGTSVAANTQSSATQVDDDDFDPFPTLPPAPSPPITAPESTLTSTPKKKYRFAMPDDRECPESEAAHQSPHSPLTPCRRYRRRGEDSRTPDRSPSCSHNQAHLPSAANASPSQAQSLSSLGSMPNIGSYGDASEIFELSPRFVRAAVHQALRGRLRREGAGESDSLESEDDGHSIPKEVKDFLSIFNSQSQSQI